MVVVIKLAGMAFAVLQIFDRRTIHQEDVHPAVIVVVEDRDAAAHRFHDVTLFEAAAGEVEINAGGLRYVDKRNTWRSRMQARRDDGMLLRRRDLLRKCRAARHGQDEPDSHPPSPPSLGPHWMGPDAIPPVTG